MKDLLVTIREADDELDVDQGILRREIEHDRFPAETGTDGLFLVRLSTIADYRAEKDEDAVGGARLAAEAFRQNDLQGGLTILFRHIVADAHIPVRFVTRRYAGVARAVDERKPPEEDAQLPANTAFDDSIARLREAWNEMLEALTRALSPGARPGAR